MEYDETIFRMFVRVQEIITIFILVCQNQPTTNK